MIKPKQAQPIQELQTLEITNFKGALTKGLLGDINSGLSPISLSHYGVDPNWDVYTNSITFLPQVVALTASPTIANPIVQMIPWMAADNSGDAVCADTAGTIRRVNISGAYAATTPDVDTVSNFTNNCGDNLTYGGGMIISNIDGASKMYVGCDNSIRKSDSFLIATNWTTMAITAVGSVPRPLVEFLGKLYAANGNNIAESTDGITFSNSTKLSPALPASYVIRDMAVSNDGRYLLMIASVNLGANQFLVTGGNLSIGGILDSVLVIWNGTDLGYTSLKFFKGVSLSSIAIGNNYTMLLGKDDEGLGIYDTDGNKLSQLFDSSSNTATYSPNNGSVFSSGDKIFSLIQRGNTVGLYMFNQSEKYFYNLYQTTIAAEVTKGACILPTLHNARFDNTEITRTQALFAFGTNLLRMHFQNASEAVQTGYYATQIQRFAKKINVKEVRVFTEPTKANTSFTSYLLNSSGTAIANSSFSYSYDPAQGAIDVIKYSPAINSTQALGFHFHNTGTAFVPVHKVEIDYYFATRPLNKQ